MNFTLLIFDTSLASSGICNNVTSALFLATVLRLHVSQQVQRSFKEDPPCKRTGR